MRKALSTTLALAAVLVASPVLGEPSVVTTIKPVNSLVMAVMQGIGTPHLLVKGAGSPHAYALKPSDATALQAADVIFLVDPDLENFLEKAIETLPTGAKTIALAGAEGVTLLPVRDTGSFEPDEHDGEAHADAQEDHGHDPHVWLDPHNARAMVTAIAVALSARDPDNAPAYSANADAAVERLDALAAEIDAELATVRDRPFIVFHDAYQYFERRFGVVAAGSIVVEPDTPPGARRVAEIRATVGKLGATCVFAEPEFEPRLVATIIEGTSARAGILDPLGADLSDSPDLYFDLLANMARSMRDCLARAS